MAPLVSGSVIGLGTAGAALVARFARAGVPVVAVATDDAALARGRARVETLLDGDGPVRYTTSLDAIRDTDVVVEAVPEDADVKAAVLRVANTVCPAHAVFATTTTALSVAGIAAAAGRMVRTVGLHVADPDRATSAELVTTPVTDPAVRDGVHELACRLGLPPVVVNDRAGFVTGTLLMASLNDAAAMVHEGYATRDDIDTAMTLGCGLPSGPLRHLDAIGLDVAVDTLNALHARTGRRRFAPAPVLEAMVATNRLGRKTGAGFYRYDADPVSSTVDGGTAPGGTRRIRSVGVLGSGTMATGIAEVCARAGYPTVVVARSSTRAKDALAAVEGSLAASVRRGRITADDAASTLARLTAADDLTAIADRDLVIEAVTEDLAVKRDRLRALDAVCRPGTVLGTTTSSLAVTAIAEATNRPHAVMGLHFFNPAPAMKLVELAYTDATAPDVVTTVRGFCASLGKRTVDCADRTGFIVNRLLFPYLNDAVAMVDDGYATVADVDTAVRNGLGYRLGPFELLDLVGLDVALSIQQRLHETLREPELEPARLLGLLVGAGYLGRKTGRGFYAR